MKFVLPRLKEFSKFKGFHPGCFKNRKQFDKVLNKIIKGFELYLQDINIDDDKVEEALDLFRMYFRALWF